MRNAACTLPHTHHVVGNVVSVYFFVACGLWKVIYSTVQRGSLDEPVRHRHGIYRQRVAASLRTVCEEGAGLRFIPLWRIAELREAETGQGFTLAGEKLLHQAALVSPQLLDTLQKGFRYIEEESFQSNFQGLFSEINLASDKLGRKYEERNAKLCSIISELARGMSSFSTDTDTLGDAYEYLIGQFAAGSGKKAGEFYTPQQISSILSAIVTLDSQAPETGPRKKLESVFDFACGSGSLLLNVRHRIKDVGGTIGKIYGQEYNVTTYNLARMNTHAELVRIEGEIRKATTKHNEFLKELGLPLLPSVRLDAN